MECIADTGKYRLTGRKTNSDRDKNPQTNHAKRGQRATTLTLSELHGIQEAVGSIPISSTRQFKGLGQPA